MLALHLEQQAEILLVVFLIPMPQRLAWHKYAVVLGERSFLPINRITYS